MSMIYWVRGLSTAQIGALRAAPALAGDLVIVTLNEGFAVRFAEAARRMPEDQRRQFEAATKSARSAPGVREAGERLAISAPSSSLSASRSPGTCSITLSRGSSVPRADLVICC